MTIGLYYGMSFADYQAIDAVNHSLLREMRRSPAHCLAYRSTPKDETKALAVGSAVHAAILEPARFEKAFSIGPTKARDTKAWKEAAFAAAPHITLITEDERALALRLAEAVRKHPLASKLCEPADQSVNEVVLVWTDRATGLTCKKRVDRIVPHYVLGQSCIVDIKTTEDGSPAAFARSCCKYGYHTQAAFYLLEEQARFIHLVIEKSEPYAVTCYELGDESLRQGRREIDRWLKRYKECQDNNDWPGYSNGLEPLELPGWAIEGIEFKPCGKE